MNILTINNWDENQSWRANGIIQKTEIANPFNQNTIEFFLLKLLEAYDGFAVSNFLRTGNDLLLKILKEANFYYYFDSYGLYYYVDRALWLGLFHGTIKIRQRYEINQRPIFGLYLESGLFDLFSDPEAINKLKNEFCNYKELMVIAKIASKYSEKLNLPKLTIENKNKEINYKFINLPRKIIDNINYLPLHTWAEPYLEDIKKGERGTFHHLGDEMAFLLAACAEGECYILGNNDCGDLMVLSRHTANEKEKKFKYNIGESLNAIDFDYIYGVPRSYASTPAKRNNHFSYSHYPQLKDKSPFPECEKFECSWWENDIFKKYAGREIKAMSIKELTTRIESKFVSIIGSAVNDNLTDILISEEKVANLFKIILIEKELLPFLKNDKFKQKIKKGNNYQTKIINLISRFLLTDDFKKEELDYYLKIYKSAVKKIFYELNLINRLTMAEIHQIVDKIFDFAWVEKANLLIKGKNNQLIENLQFFYKTVAHKEHCGLVNCKENSFFKKGENVNFNSLDIKKFYTFLLERIEHFYNQQINQYNYKNHQDSNLYNNLIFSEFLLPIDKSVIIQEGEWKRFYDQIFSDLIVEILANNKSNIHTKELLNYWRNFDQESIIYSEVLNLKYEYRIFVVNNRIRATSACYRNSTPFDCYEGGIIDPRLADGHSANERIEDKNSRKIVAAFAKAARKFNKEIEKEYPQYKHYVIDFALVMKDNYCDGNKQLNLDKITSNDLTVVPIEINSILFSGAYSIDFRKVVAAFANKKFTKNSIKEINDYKQIFNDCYEEVNKEINLLKQEAA